MHKNQLMISIFNVCFPSGTKILWSSVLLEVASDSGFKVRSFHMENKD